ncbi:hypothetical protein HY483_02395 [Candidatus Woesearchaeota archaeon]|nr:hypothetical protein [Candidatus Woesearchaeota archaeon]
MVVKNVPLRGSVVEPQVPKVEFSSLVSSIRDSFSKRFNLPLIVDYVNSITTDTAKIFFLNDMNEHVPVLELSKFNNRVIAYYSSKRFKTDDSSLLRLLINDSGFVCAGLQPLR